MRVLYFHQHFSTPSGSAGIRSYEMAKGLLLQGHRVTMVCGSYGAGKTGLSNEFVNGRRDGRVDGIDIIEFDLEYSNADGLLRRTYTFLKFAIRSIVVSLTHKYDIVFATTTPLTAGIPGIFARWFRNKPFVFEVRDLWPELPRAMGVVKNPIILYFMSFLEWCSYHSAHRCIGLSPGIIEGIKKRGIKEELIKFIPNGCDLEILEKTSTTWRPKGVEDTDFMAVFAGTHGIANGLDAALDAASILKKQNRMDIKIVLVGQGKLKEKLQVKARLLKLNNVIFQNSVNKQRLAELMSGADIGLQLLANIPAFYYGTSPNKFFDYISAGLPVLNNYPGWLADIIIENSCGYAVEPNNPKAFANALIHAADSRGELYNMGQRAQRLAKRDFNRFDLTKKWVDWVIGVEK